MYVYRYVFTPSLKLKQVTKKVEAWWEVVGSKKQGREKYPTKASPVKRGREKKKIKPLERILKTEESWKRYWDLEAFQKAQQQEERQMCPAGVPGSHPTCRQGQTDSHVRRPAGAAGSRAAAAQRGRGGLGLGLRRPAELGGSTVPSAVRGLLFQRRRQDTIQGNDYYIILKEYGLERAEAAPSHVVLGDRSPGLHGDAAHRPRHATPLLPALGGDAAPRSHFPQRPARESVVCQGLRFASSSCFLHLHRRHHSPEITPHPGGDRNTRDFALEKCTNKPLAQALNFSWRANFPST